MTGLADTLSSAALGQPASALVVPQQPQPSPVVWTSNEQQMIDLTNQDRVNAGLNPLASDPTMLAIARQRAQMQQGQQPLNHNDPTTGMWAFLNMLAQAQVPMTAGAGENLARSYPWQVPGIEQAFLNSPAHRANIMDPRWTQMAVGAWNDPNQQGGDLAELYR